MILNESTDAGARALMAADPDLDYLGAVRRLAARDRQVALSIAKAEAGGNLIYLAEPEAVSVFLEAGEVCRIECARSGEFRDMRGKILKLDERTLLDIADRFDPAGFHKIKLGHVEITSDSPDYGDVTGLQFDRQRDRLIALAVPTPITVELNRKSGFRRCSMELSGETAAGPWHFQHLSLLGARRPAIEGLEPLQL
jgi:hypothetical protein